VDRLFFFSRRDTMMTSVASFQTNSIRAAASRPRSALKTIGKDCESFCGGAGGGGGGSGDVRGRLGGPLW
jgi:hypothetical protein